MIVSGVWLLPAILSGTSQTGHLNGRCTERTPLLSPGLKVDEKKISFIENPYDFLRAACTRPLQGHRESAMSEKSDAQDPDRERLILIHMGKNILDHVQESEFAVAEDGKTSVVQSSSALGRGGSMAMLSPRDAPCSPVYNFLRLFTSISHPRTHA